MFNSAFKACCLIVKLNMFLLSVCMTASGCKGVILKTRARGPGCSFFT